MSDCFKLKKNYYYFVCPGGLGDTKIICGLSSYIYDKYGKNIVFIVKPSHVSIVKMYHIEHYLIHTYSKDELLFYSSKCEIPLKGELFVAHPEYHPCQILSDFYNLKVGFYDMYKEWLDLSADAVISNPIISGNLSEKVRRQIEGDCVRDYVLISPEMNSCKMNGAFLVYFRCLIQKLLKRGEKVILNTTTDILKEYDNLKIDLSMEDLLIFASKCKEIISARSGLCDLLYEYKDKMTVIYPSSYYYHLFSLGNHVREHIITCKAILEKKGYRNCAIYGIGKIGRELIRELEFDEFTIQYCIDNYTATDCKYPVYREKDDLPPVDVIIVAIKKGGDTICQKLKTIIPYDVIYYEELEFI